MADFSPSPSSQAATDRSAIGSSHDASGSARESTKLLHHHLDDDDDNISRSSSRDTSSVVTIHKKTVERSGFKKGRRKITASRKEFSVLEFLRKQKQARIWIEEITGHRFKFDTEADADINFIEQLRDGVILCDLTNKLVPGSVPTNKIHRDTKLKFKQTENINFFLQTSLSVLEIPSTFAFEISDLWELR
eukprot:GEZU01019498.1.p1 GENE.GEZU01019498.1~~GEZU01019498.1.p1  ORF type:complete len:191 (-),score=45.85 GEZU01019498.1:22-594(-)